MKLRQVARAGAQSGTIMTLADVGTQLFVEGKKSKDDYSVERTLRWTVTGLTLHGPYFLAGFAWLDKQFGATATSLRVVATKTVVGQLCLFPPYLVILFSAMGYMEGHPNIPQKLLTHVPQAFQTGCIFWPIANMFNFSFVPPTMRVPYIACAGGLWNSYLSWTNAKDRIEIQQEQDETAR